jgi:hypothetical protein
MIIAFDFFEESGKRRRVAHRAFGASDPTMRGTVMKVHFPEKPMRDVAF